MRTKWAKHSFVVLLFAILGWALGWGVSRGLDYGFAHWWRGNEYVGIGLLLDLPIFVAANLLHHHDATGGISNEFGDAVYGFIGCVLFIGVAIMFLAVRRAK